MKNDPMTILITVGLNKSYVIEVTKPQFASFKKELYACEGIESLFDRLVRLLGLFTEIKITIEKKEA